MEPEEIGRQSEGEPSVLDWVKSVLSRKPIQIPDQPESQPPVAIRQPIETKRVFERPSIQLSARQIRLPTGLFLAFIAQRQLETRVGPVWISLVMYLISAGLVVWGYLAGDFPFSAPTDREVEPRSIRFRPGYFLAALVFTFLTALTAGENTFQLPTLVFWAGALFSILLALWDGELNLRKSGSKILTWLQNPRINIQIDGWGVAFLAVFGVSIFFRFYRLDQIPFEMWSDHAEKLLDVIDVLNGKYSIFFPRNTGREAFQFYLAAATASWLGTGISFLTLKIGTALAGVVALPFIYLFGREMYGRRVGLFAMALAGIAYWPNAISRLGLRFPLYPLFAAPALYFMARGLKRKSINDFLICGLFVGLGLHGYSPTRILPLVIAFGVLIFLLHRDANGHRARILFALLAAGVVALIVFTPLLRVGLDMQDVFLFRSLSRLGTAERDLPGNPIVIFLTNLKDALGMFGWDNGEIWVISLPHRPALDWITAGLFHLGVVLIIARYIRERKWEDIFIVLSIPLLMMPSILSLAFPAENPAPNRASGAIIPVFTIAGLQLVVLLDWVQRQWPQSRRAHVAVNVVVILMIIMSGMMNYNLIFNEFSDQHRRGTWNTSDAGRLIRGFAESIGSYEHAHVVPFPHWMDTRLVGIHAGTPTKDYALWPADFSTLYPTPEPRLFLLNPADEEGLSLLRQMFPEGVVRLYPSPLEGKDIVAYYVPPNSVMNRLTPEVE